MSRSGHFPLPMLTLLMFPLIAGACDVPVDEVDLVARQHPHGFSRVEVVEGSVEPQERSAHPVGSSSAQGIGYGVPDKKQEGASSLRGGASRR